MASKKIISLNMIFALILIAELVCPIKASEVRNGLRPRYTPLQSDRSSAMEPDAMLAYIFEFYDSDALLSPVRMLKKRSINANPLLGPVDGMEDYIDFDNRYDVIEVNEIVRDNQLSLDLQELIIRSLDLLETQQANSADQLKNNQAASMALEMMKVNLHDALYDLQTSNDATTMHRVLNDLAQANNFYQALRKDLQTAADGDQKKHNEEALGAVKPLFDLYMAIQEQFERVKNSGSMSDAVNAYSIIKSFANRMVDFIKTVAVGDVDENTKNSHEIINKNKTNNNNYLRNNANVDVLDAIAPVVGPANKPAVAPAPPQAPKPKQLAKPKSMPKSDMSQQQKTALNGGPFNLSPLGDLATDNYAEDDDDDNEFMRLLVDY